MHDEQCAGVDCHFNISWRVLREICWVAVATVGGKKIKNKKHEIGSEK